MSLKTGNKNIVTIMGIPNTGKTYSAKYLKEQENKVYFNTDLKEPSFKSDFIDVSISDPIKIFNGIRQVEETDKIDMAILDTLTFLTDMYEQQYVIDAPNTQKAWGQYASFYMKLIHAIKAGTKDYAIFSHQADTYNEKEMSIDTRIPIKGAVGRRGAEADFTTILAAKRLSVDMLQEHKNDLLTFSDEELEDGVKYVFQTRITKDTLGEKMRSADALWSRKELYIDNNLQNVFDRLHTYYGEK